MTARKRFQPGKRRSVAGWQIVLAPAADVARTSIVAKAKRSNEAEADMAFARLRDLEDKLVAMAAFTSLGMRAKAMVISRVCWGSEV